MQSEAFDYSPTVAEEVGKLPYGTDWPVVYIIYGDEEAYVGESCNASRRMADHRRNPERDALKKVLVMTDGTFNKSAVLDIEQHLIRYCGADRRFVLQNVNLGQSYRHNYYQRELYLNKIPEIWKELLKRRMASNDLDTIRNRDLFRYSPYTTLTPDQAEASREITENVLRALQSGGRGATVVDGSAGTGKTVLATSLMFKLVNADRENVDNAESVEGFTDEQATLHDLRSLARSRRLRVGIVFPMKSIRNTIRKVYRETKNGLSASLVLSPADVVNSEEDFDVLLVDESHRLVRRRNITWYEDFDRLSRNVGLDPEEATELDWIVRRSRYQVLFYDGSQTVRGSDISEDQLFGSLEGDVRECKLTSQLRCLGGNDYIRYVEGILELSEDRDGAPERTSFESYDLRIFDDVDDMVRSVRSLNTETCLSRNVAGIGWEWKSTNNRRKKTGEEAPYDIEIGDYRYRWNSVSSEWILSEKSIDEIGSIHSIQGYDLGFVGVIFGPEIDYSEGRLVVYRDRFKDKNAKNGTDDEALRRYVLNAYKVLMTRGVYGCYVYAYNPSLSEYLRRFFDQAHKPVDAEKILNGLPRPFSS